MIIGIGVDVVDTPRFQGSLVRTPGLNTRLFTEKELNSPGGKGENAVSLAANRAANETAFSPLPPGVFNSFSVNKRVFKPGVLTKDP